MIKLDLVNQIVERTGVSKTKAEQAVDTIFNCMKDALKANDRIELRGFGVFSVKPRKTGIGRNPRTGSEVKHSSREGCTIQARQRLAVSLVRNVRV